MSVSVGTILETGLDGVKIDIECHISNGLPSVVVVGLGNKAIEESKERLRSAFSTSSAELPKKRITLNLAPADIPKDGTSLDLAMAASILLASSQIKPVLLNDSLVIGELGLNGAVRPVRGIIGKIMAAKKLGYTMFYIPAANQQQAGLVPGIQYIPLKNLNEFYLHASGAMPLDITISRPVFRANLDKHSQNFSEVIGQARAKRALEIAAVGGHNILMSGPPGTGKSMLAKALPSILPDPSPEEILEITHLHSLASKQYEQIVTQRPFRGPHHTASNVSILGGGQNPRPGEISLSHHGVLFLDELPEYSRQTIEALRQPLEDHVITIARAKDTLVFPAQFMLVATANPCPCGYYGSSKSCSCSAAELVKYQRKLSGPILDRIDLYVDVDETDHAALLSEHQSESSTAIKRRVDTAKKFQALRSNDPMLLNSTMNNKQVKSLAKLSPKAKLLLDNAAQKLDISARAYMRAVKVARSIADLEGSETIEVPHITEALQYRRSKTI